MVLFLFTTVTYVFLLLCLCILIVCLCIFIVPAGTLRLPWLRVFRDFSSVVRQMPGQNPQRRGMARTLPKILCCSMYCLFCVVLCIVCVYMCTVLLPPGGYQIAFNKYISYHIRVLWWCYVTRRTTGFVYCVRRQLLPSKGKVLHMGLFFVIVWKRGQDPTHLSPKELS